MLRLCNDRASRILCAVCMDSGIRPHRILYRYRELIAHGILHRYEEIGTVKHSGKLQSRCDWSRETLTAKQVPDNARAGLTWNIEKCKEVETGRGFLFSLLTHLRDCCPIPSPQTLPDCCQAGPEQQSNSCLTSVDWQSGGRSSVNCLSCAHQRLCCKLKAV